MAQNQIGLLTSAARYYLIAYAVLSLGFYWNSLRSLAAPVIICTVVAVYTLVFGPATTTLMDFIIAVFLSAALVYRLGPASVVRWMFWLTLAYVMVSAAISVGIPRYGAMPSGEWRGLAAHKNTLGSMSACLVILAVAASSLGRVWRIAAVGAAALCLFGSQSTGALVALGGAVFCIALKRYGTALRPKQVGQMIVFLTICIVCIAAYFYAENILSIFGRDATLTGRTKIWQAVFPLTDLFHGRGYGAYAEGGTIDAISQAIGTFYQAVDNAYMILALELGWAVTVAYAGWLIVSIVGEGRREFLTFRVAASAFALLLAIVERTGGPYPYLPFTLVLIGYYACRLPLRAEATALDATHSIGTKAPSLT